MQAQFLRNGHFQEKEIRDKELQAGHHQQPDPALSSSVNIGSYCLYREIRGLWGHFAPHDLDMGIRTKPGFYLDL